ncbi:MAG: glycosyltransferase family 2 protein [Calditrichaeota bacterium]|nr:MAG: glycosyltransferase family 2 protein [Calditrichota bacterium]
MNSVSSPDISICISTYKRPEQLHRLLLSLIQQVVNVPYKCEIIVVDNDEVGSGRLGLVNQWPEDVPLKYVIEPRQNISHARNKALDEANGYWLAFIDDDEIAGENWLQSYWRIIQKNAGDGFFGPVLPRFEKDVGTWLAKDSLYHRPRFSNGVKIGYSQTRTSNAFVKRDVLKKYRFDPNFGRLGGGDVELFYRMAEDGSIFYWCDEAVVFEYFPIERVNMSWLLRRAFRGGVSYTKIQKKHHPNLVYNLVRMVKSMAGLLVFTFILPLEFFRGRLQVVRRMQKILVQVGHVCGVFNVKFEEYKK